MKISVVTTVYHSEKYLFEFYTRTKFALKQVMEQKDSEITDSEIVFVNDGSPDQSIEILKKLQKADNQVIIIDLSRNFGHHMAMSAGLAQATGDYIFLIDCDLEESPELLVELWNKLKSDTDIDATYGVQTKRKGNFFEVHAGKLFYRFLNSIINIKYPHDSLTARLMTRQFVNAVLTYKEKSLELWSVFTFVGFRQEPVYTKKLSKGSTTYNLTRKLRLAIETITATSNRPLYFIFVLGILIFLLSGAYLSYIIYISLTQEGVVEGWASTIASIWLVGGITILLLGIIAIYLAKIFHEVKARPLYTIKSIYKDQQPQP